LLSVVENAEGDIIRANEAEQRVGVGDGALWIATQIKAIFGEPGRFLVDFYHVCEYLAEVSHICSPNDSETWIENQKNDLSETSTKLY
jgi:hypothetical protein